MKQIKLLIAAVIVGLAAKAQFLIRDSTLGGFAMFPLAKVIVRAHIYNVADYGILPNGLDQTAAFNALLIRVHSAWGGTIQFNSGQYLFSGKIKFPYITDNPNYPIQPYQRSIRIVGMGSDACGIVYYLNHGATTFNMIYTGTPAKIDTRGAGALEISNISFINTNSFSDSTPFIHTTCTSLFIHHNSFAGAGLGRTESVTDAIILGGTTDIVDSTVNSGFQGYGTTIEVNNFHKMRRAVYGRTFANAVNVLYNNIFNSCGANTNAAAIEFLGQPNNACSGNEIHGNLIELINYKFGIKLRYCAGFNISGNHWDRSGFNLWPIYLGQGSEFNTVTEYFALGMTASVYDSSGNNTIWSSLAGGTTKIPNNIQITGDAIKLGQTGLKVRDYYANEHVWRTEGFPSNGPVSVSLTYKPSGGSEEVLSSYNKPGGIMGLKNILGLSDTIYVKIQSGASDLYLNQATGKTMFFGEEYHENQYIEGGIFTSRNKPITYSSVPHSLITGEALVPRSLLDSIIATVRPYTTRAERQSIIRNALAIEDISASYLDAAFEEPSVGIREANTAGEDVILIASRDYTVSTTNGPIQNLIYEFSAGGGTFTLPSLSTSERLTLYISNTSSGTIRFNQPVFLNSSKSKTTVRPESRIKIVKKTGDTKYYQVF